MTQYFTARKDPARRVVNLFTKSMLGAALAGQKKHAEAESFLVGGYEGMKEREAQIPAAGKVRLTEVGAFRKG